jgi:hypothetical protein
MKLIVKLIQYKINKNAMNASNTYFGKIFLNFLESLAESFPDCKETARILNLITSDPHELDTIKLDWARHISTHDIHAFPHVVQYFQTVQSNVSKDHIFHKLKLFEKYQSIGQDLDAKNDFCSFLADLQPYALDDSIVDGSQNPDPSSILVEEPSTPPAQSSALTPVSGTSASTISGRGRFDDDKLHELCVQRTGDRKFVEDLREFSRHFPILNRYAQDSDEQIANRLKQMKPILQGLLAMIRPLLKHNNVSQANGLIEGIMKKFDPKLKPGSQKPGPTQK